MGGAFLLRLHRKEGVSDVDALEGIGTGAGETRRMLTGTSPKSKDNGGWLGKASRASRVSADMRTIMARLGFDWTALEVTWREREVLFGRGMVGGGREGQIGLRTCGRDKQGWIKTD